MWWPLDPATFSLHNNGPLGPADAGITFAFATPPGCEALLAGVIPVPPNTSVGPIPLSAVVTIPPLPVSIATNITLPVNTILVRCTTPGFHTFTMTLVISPVGLVEDPDPTNNTTTSGFTTEALGPTVDYVAIDTDITGNANPAAGTMGNPYPALPAG